MEAIQQALQETVKGLFDSGRIDLLVGYEKGTLPLRSRPVIVSSAEDADRLVWNNCCSNNLAVYLPGLLEKKPPPKRDAEPPPIPKVGIVAKGCDLRSVAGLIKEKQAPAGNVVSIGMPCQGMVDTSKIVAALNGDTPLECREDSDGSVSVATASGEEKKFEREEVLMEACAECAHTTPDGADLTIDGKSRTPADEQFGAVNRLGGQPAEQRWQYLVDETSRCIRCYACRQACPNCYCKECFAEQTAPKWIGVSTELTDVLLYHIGRIFHQAGRCVGCDACVHACPMGIDLRPFTQKVVKDVEELFGYVPGASPEDVPPLCTFQEDDSQEFITGP